LEIQQDIKNPREFMSNLKMALFPDEVYVFTPHGDVKSFPKGATPIDFAYSIHTDIGHQCIGAKVNRNIVPLRYQLQNGDQVEIITQAGHHPSKDWLKYVVTSRAISKIRNWINAEEKSRSLMLGKDLLEKEFRRHNLKFASFIKSEELKEILAEYSLPTLDDLVSQVGFGRISAKQIANQCLLDKEGRSCREPAKTTEKEKKQATPAPMGITLTGIDDVMVRFGKCCNPIPGDEIAGYISRGRGITVHAQDCPHLKRLDSERIVEVQWDLRQKHAYPVHIRVICNDQKGVLTEISSVITSFDVNISFAQVETTDMIAKCEFVIDVNDTHQLNAIFAAIRQLKIVRSIERLNKG